MPEFASAAEIADHLRAVISEQTHWVLITDHIEAHLAFVQVASGLLGDGVPGGVFRYGCFNAIDRTTGMPTTVSCFTVPKSHVRAKRLGRLLREFGVDARPGADRDLIVVSYGDGLSLGHVLEELRTGSAQPVADPGLN